MTTGASPLLRCPACGAEMSLDVALTHDELRRAVAELISVSLPLGSLITRYVGLFRPSKNRLSGDRMARLVGQLVPDIQRGAITHRGRDWTVPLECWRSGFEAMLAKAASGKLDLPLESHAYLYTVLTGMAEKVEAAAEAEREDGRRHGQEVAERRAGSAGTHVVALQRALDPALRQRDLAQLTATPAPESVRALRDQLTGRKPTSSN